MAVLTPTPLRHQPAPAPRRPLTLLAILAGAAAALGPLVVCLGVAVVGWFVADAGAHGQPSDALRVGALGWLSAHGSGFLVHGVRITFIPLGLTAIVAWSIWRLSHRLGELVSGHGPDADRVVDGERDWTVPVATTIFTASYAVVAVVTGTLASTVATQPSLGRVLLMALALCVGVGGAGVAVGSGRAAIWTTLLPAAVRGGFAAFVSILTTLLVVSTGVFVVALLHHWGEAANVFSGLSLHTGDSVVYGLLSALLVPNAAVFTGSWLLGPGFAIGAKTLVTPAVTVLGPLPLFPLVAALPHPGPVPGWMTSLIGVPAVVAAVAAARAQRRHPCRRWDVGPLRALGGGIAAAVAFAVLARFAGGTAGPGRLQVVHPFAFDVLVHGVTSLGLGALVGGLVMTWWQRRH